MAPRRQYTHSRISPAAIVAGFVGVIVLDLLLLGLGVGVVLLVLRAFGVV